MNEDHDPEIAKKWVKRTTLFAFVALLISIGFLGFAIFVQGQNIADENHNPLFLPVIFQAETFVNPNASASFIHWNSSSAPFKTAVGQALVTEVAGQEYLYLLGGGEAFGSKSQLVRTDRTAYAEIHQDGSLGAWSDSSDGSLPPLPLKLHGFSATAVKENIYLLGGYVYPDSNDPYPNVNARVYCAKLGANGEFQNWEEFYNTWESEEDIPEMDHELGVAYHTTVLVGNRLYLIGGLRKYKFFNHPWEPTPYVFSAEVGDTCQSLKWRAEENFPFRVTGHTAVAADNGSIYVFGGRTYRSQPGNCYGQRVDSQPISYRGKIDNTGSIVQWVTQAQIPEFTSVQFSTAVQSGNYLYVIGGSPACHPFYGAASDAIYRTKIGPDDDIQTWQKMDSIDTSPDQGQDHLYGLLAVVSKLERIYVIGGVNANGNDPPTVQDKIYWTPLVFFSKESFPSNEVVPGQEVEYELTITSNNVRDIVDAVLKDTLPENVEVLKMSGFTSDGQTLTAALPDLPVGHLIRMFITVIIKSPDTTVSPALPVAVPVASPPSALHEASRIPPVSSMPEMPVQVVENFARPTAVKGCVTDAAVPDSGTPRPKPTCTPMPTSTNTATPPPVTDTPTYTATPTPTDTVTVEPPTPTPAPVLLVNTAEFCFVEKDNWCMSATDVNAPFHTYLPQVAK
ncbi:MAG: DUF11 domain-containing protein [Ardenticatenaceae bacterium]|nr:DUF11 domain-containing protein [Ardenticatenaceae bacterium]